MERLPRLAVRFVLGTRQTPSLPFGDSWSSEKVETQSWTLSVQADEHCDNGHTGAGRSLSQKASWEGRCKWKWVPSPGEQQGVREGFLEVSWWVQLWAQPGLLLPLLLLQGKKFLGDLQPDGRIVWQETGQVFNSPSAWATHCKKLVNPAKKSGCGWASVKYKGQKLDKYKAAWLRRHQLHIPTAAADEVRCSTSWSKDKGFPE